LAIKQKIKKCRKRPKKIVLPSNWGDKKKSEKKKREEFFGVCDVFEK